VPATRRARLARTCLRRPALHHPPWTRTAPEAPPAAGRCAGVAGALDPVDLPPATQSQRCVPDSGGWLTIRCHLSVDAPTVRDHACLTHPIRHLEALREGRLARRPRRIGDAGVPGLGLSGGVLHIPRQPDCRRHRTAKAFNGLIDPRQHGARRLVGEQRLAHVVDVREPARARAPTQQHRDLRWPGSDQRLTDPTPRDPRYRTRWPPLGPVRTSSALARRSRSIRSAVRTQIMVHTVSAPWDQTAIAPGKHAEPGAHEHPNLGPATPPTVEVIAARRGF